MSVFFAHIRSDEEGFIKQTLRNHSEKTALYASGALLRANLSSSAFLIGLLHDMGKAKKEFQEYLAAASLGEGKARGSVNHTFAAVRYMLSEYHKDLADTEDEALESLIPELLAFAMGAHHGLFDLADSNAESGFEHRVRQTNIDYEESVEGYFNACTEETKVKSLYRSASRELLSTIDMIDDLVSACKDDNCADMEYCFHLSLLARLLLSAVIEGDRRDTAEFMNGTVFRCDPEDMKPLWGKAIAHMERKLQDFSGDSELTRARRSISEQCLHFAEEKEEIYRLNVPTGAGKTLSSLRFALHHAKRWNKSRIIYVMPLISILEQNAEVIRSFVGDDSLILEHHSNVLSESGGLADAETENWLEALRENWQSPIVITTLVQFLNTLYSHKTSSIRRFQALCGSIIIFDEVQTVPVKMLTLFNLAVSFLKHVCHATVIMCSATQPCFEEARHPISQINLEEDGEPVTSMIRDMVPYDEKLWQTFKRTTIKDFGSMELEDVPSLARQLLEKVNSVLVVCNTRKEAGRLFELFTEGEKEADVFHLSASMCMAHRRSELEDLYHSLERGRHGRRKTICVATQVIEAGVDISFGSVIRLCAGLDSVIQSAGRCNRNRESDSPAPVFIVRILGEKLGNLDYIESGQNAALELLEEFKADPKRFDSDLSSDKAVQGYYHFLYREMKTNSQDYVISGGICDGKSIFDLLSFNTDFASSKRKDNKERYFMQQAFKSAGENFKVIDSQTVDVVVPYGRGRGLISELFSERAKQDHEELGRLLQEAKNYSVSVYEHQLRKLEKEGALETLFEGKITVLTDGFYDNKTGLSFERGKLGYMEVIC